MGSCVFYVSGHGFGHATRIAAVIAALKARKPELKIAVRTEAPAWLFSGENGGLSVSSSPIDVGIIQKNALDNDLEATLRAHESAIAVWRERSKEEAEFLRSIKATLVVGDIPALAFDAARRAGVKSAAIANFSWDWILEPYAAGEPRWKQVIERYRESYQLADLLLRLPMHGEFPAFRQVLDSPLLARRSRFSRSQARRGLGLKDGCPAVLVSFGGFGAGPVSFAAGEDLSGFDFLGFGPKPEGLNATWRELPLGTPMAHVDAVAAADVIIGKPGYGTISESIVHQTRMLYLPRPGYTEIPPLVEGLNRWGCGRMLPKEDFFAGRWGSHIQAVLSQPASWSDSSAEGADFIASELLGLLV